MLFCGHAPDRRLKPVEERYTQGLTRRPPPLVGSQTFQLAHLYVAGNAWDDLCFLLLSFLVFRFSCCLGCLLEAFRLFRGVDHFHTEFIHTTHTIGSHLPKKCNIQAYFVRRFHPFFPREEEKKAQGSLLLTLAVLHLCPNICLQKTSHSRVLLRTIPLPQPEDMGIHYRSSVFYANTRTVQRRYYLVSSLDHEHHRHRGCGSV